MPQPNDLSRSLVALDQDSTIIAVVEMSQSSWLVGGILAARPIASFWWRKTDSNPRSLSGEEGDRTTPSLASNDFHGSKYPNGQSKTAEAAVVKQQFDSVWARADIALTASAFF